MYKHREKSNKCNTYLQIEKTKAFQLMTKLKGTNYLSTYFFFKKTNWVVKIFENQNPFGIL